MMQILEENLRRPDVCIPNPAAGNPVGAFQRGEEENKSLVYFPRCFLSSQKLLGQEGVS